MINDFSLAMRLTFDEVNIEFPDRVRFRRRILDAYESQFTGKPSPDAVSLNDIGDAVYKRVVINEGGVSELYAIMEDMTDAEVLALS